MEWVLREDEGFVGGRRAAAPVDEISGRNVNGATGDRGGRAALQGQGSERAPAILRDIVHVHVRLTRSCWRIPSRWPGAIRKDQRNLSESSAQVCKRSPSIWLQASYWVRARMSKRERVVMCSFAPAFRSRCSARCTAFWLPGLVDRPEKFNHLNVCNSIWEQVPAVGAGTAQPPPIKANLG